MIKLITIILIIAGITGMGKCIYKACTCNWNPIGKAEVIYTIGALTGTGCVIGYIDIEDK